MCQLYAVEKFDQELRTVQEVEIYDKVEVTPKTLFLPWDPPHFDNNYNYHVKVGFLLPVYLFLVVAVVDNREDIADTLPDL